MGFAAMDSKMTTSAGCSDAGGHGHPVNVAFAHFNGRLIATR